MITNETKSSAPVISIGMPSYNAAQTIRSAVDSLLRQTFSDFELIISDNSSSDTTWSIINEYARQDSRVIPLQQKQNIGANGNYSAVFRLARGRYFKWASSNDWCDPGLLEKCCAYLDAHSDVVLVAPRTRLFQDSPTKYTSYELDLAFDQSDPVQRFIEVGSHLALNNVINGLARTNALRRTRLVEHYPGADVVLLAQLALFGKIALLEERLYYRRMERETATPLMSMDAVYRHHYPRPTTRALFPTWRSAVGWGRVALSSGLPLADAWRAFNWVLRSTSWRRALLWDDVVAALRFSVRRKRFGR